MLGEGSPSGYRWPWRFLVVLPLVVFHACSFVCSFTTLADFLSSPLSQCCLLRCSLLAAARSAAVASLDFCSAGLLVMARRTCSTNRQKVEAPTRSRACAHNAAALGSRPMISL